MRFAQRSWIGLLALLAGLLTLAADFAPAQSPGYVVGRPDAPPSVRRFQTPARTTGHVPKNMRMAAASEPAPAQPGKVVEGPSFVQEEPGVQMMLSGSEAGCESCAADGNCGTCELEPCGCFLPFGNVEIFGGVSGFTGPANRGGSGSFGFYEGVNLAIPLPGFSCLGGQVGFRGVHSNFSGANTVGNGFTSESRNQGFFTAGLFRRVDVGLQGGVVVDYLSDGWYRDVNLTNLRGELSWVFNGLHDVGFWFSASSRQQTAASTLLGQAPINETWEGTSLYAFFYRVQFGECRDGDARLLVGWSEHSDGFIGAETRLPLGEAWALEAGFAYLVPQEGATPGLTGGAAQESWNVSLGLVWYPGRAHGRNNSPYYRPLIRVADNGTFMMDRLP